MIENLENAVANFFRYLIIKKPFIGSGSKILFICDDFNLNLVENIANYFNKQGINVKLLLVNSPNDIVNIETLILNFDTILVFYVDTNTGMSTPYGNPLFQKLIPYLEYDLIQEQRKFLVFLDINEFFDELYFFPPEFFNQHNKKLIDKLTSCTSLTFKSNRTCLYSKTKNIYPWKSTTLARDDVYPSEVASYAKDINGKINFTGLILGKLPFPQKYGLICDPITFEIENSQLRKFKVSDKNLKKDLDFYFNYSESNRYIHEIGIGTNLGLKSLRPINSFAQERFPGFHLGFGGKSENSMHIDFIFLNSEIHGDENPIFQNRKFFL